MKVANKKHKLAVMAMAAIALMFGLSFVSIEAQIQVDQPMPTAVPTPYPTPAPAVVEPGTVVATPDQIVVILLGFMSIAVPIAGGLMRQSIINRIDTTKKENDAKIIAAKKESDDKIESAKRDSDAKIESARLAAQRDFELKVQELTVASQQTTASGQNTGALAVALSKLADANVKQADTNAKLAAVMEGQLENIGTKVDTNATRAEAAGAQAVAVGVEMDKLREYLISQETLTAEEATKAAADINEMFTTIGRQIEGYRDTIIAAIPPPFSEAKLMAMLQEPVDTLKSMLAKYKLIVDEQNPTVNTSVEEATKAAVISTAISTAAATAAQAAQPPPEAEQKP